MVSGERRRRSPLNRTLGGTDHWTITELRSNAYAIVDRVVATGEPVRIERNGHVVELRLVEAAEPAARDLATLTVRDAGVGPGGDLEEIGWTGAWDGEPELDAEPGT